MNKQQAQFHVKYNGEKKPDGMKTARWKAMVAQIKKEQNEPEPQKPRG